MPITLDGTNGVTTNSGTLISATTIGVGGATPAASGAGITFPATQSASTDANTLDDYEEGTWTPSVGGNATYTTRTANYTKVGNLVYIHCTITINTLGTGSTVVLSGLPFTSKNTGTAQGIYVCYYLSLANSITWLSGYVENNATTVQFTGNSTAATSIQNNGFAVFGNSTTLIFSGVYVV